MNRTKRKENVFIEHNNVPLSNEKSLEKITEFYNRLFNEENKQSFEDIKPEKMKMPFSKEEVIKAVNSLKNNKSPGPDNISAEQLKHCPDIIYQHIADIFNEIAETGSYPEEINKGILIPLQKPGKEKGKVENLRPIILLNMIRKILSKIILDRIITKLDNEIPITQSAYRKGRGTTENVFTFKILAEKAISEENCEIYLRLLDMSKAFDSVNRTLLIEDLKKILAR